MLIQRISFATILGEGAILGSEFEEFVVSVWAPNPMSATVNNGGLVTPLGEDLAETWSLTVSRCIVNSHRNHLKVRTPRFTPKFLGELMGFLHNAREKDLKVRTNQQIFISDIVRV